VEAVPRRSLRWLLPANSERWIGSNDGAKVAEVWPDGLIGNQVEQWNWQVMAKGISGYFEGTGDDDRDLYSAQDCASKAFFEE